MRNFRQRHIDAATAIAFFALLIVPCVALLFGIGRDNVDFIENVEGRTMATMPPVAEAFPRTGAYTRKVELALGDAFPLRKWLITAYYLTKVSLLRDSPHESVIIGRDGWMFYAGIELQYIDGRPALSDVDLENVVRVFRKRQAWCAAHGARFVLVFAPNKSTVYAEELPEGYRLVQPTALARLLPRLRAGGVDVVDVLPALVTARKHGDVYSRGDTHWNDRGAFAAYQTIARSLAPLDVDPLTRLRFTPVDDEARGDLFALAGVGDVLKDKQIDYVFRAHARQRSIRSSIYGLSPGNVSGTVIDDRRLPTAVLFGDSFSDRLAPFFSEGFRRVLFPPAQFDKHIVLVEHPQVVVQEIVERDLVDSARWSP
jgi:alginate O-acetyltransferase complex protein AlgJ